MRQTLLHSLFPQVRAEILRLLFTNPRTELYVRDLARLSGLSLQTVQDELETGSGSSHRQPEQWLSPLLSCRFQTPALRHSAKAGRPRFLASEAPAKGERPAPTTSAPKQRPMIAPRSRHLNRSLSRAVGIDEAAKRRLTALYGQDPGSGAKFRTFNQDVDHDFEP